MAKCTKYSAGVWRYSLRVHPGRQLDIEVICTTSSATLYIHYSSWTDPHIYQHLSMSPELSDLSSSHHALYSGLREAQFSGWEGGVVNGQACWLFPKATSKTVNAALQTYCMLCRHYSQTLASDGLKYPITLHLLYPKDAKLLLCYCVHKFSSHGIYWLRLPNPSGYHEKKGSRQVLWRSRCAPIGHPVLLPHIFPPV